MGCSKQLPLNEEVIHTFSDRSRTNFVCIYLCRSLSAVLDIIWSSLTSLTDWGTESQVSNYDYFYTLSNLLVRITEPSRIHVRILRLKRTTENCYLDQRNPVTWMWWRAVVERLFHSSWMVRLTLLPVSVRCCLPNYFVALFVFRIVQKSKWSNEKNCNGWGFPFVKRERRFAL